MVSVFRKFSWINWYHLPYRGVQRQIYISRPKFLWFLCWHMQIHLFLIKHENVLHILVVLVCLNNIEIYASKRCQPLCSPWLMVFIPPLWRQNQFSHTLASIYKPMPNSRVPLPSILYYYLSHSPQYGMYLCLVVVVVGVGG